MSWGAATRGTDPARSFRPRFGERTRLACCLRRPAEDDCRRHSRDTLGETPRAAGGTPALPGPFRSDPDFGQLRSAFARWSHRLLATACLLPLMAHAHPLHLSHAEADFNRATGKLEVALKVFADDLEARLTARAGHRVSLEKTPPAEFDALCLAYLAETFTVKSRDGTPRSIQWVGREFKDAENRLWFYFEVPLPDGVEGARLRHAVLTDEFTDQLNSVLVRDGQRSATLAYFPDRGEKTVAFPRY